MLLSIAKCFVLDLVGVDVCSLLFDTGDANRQISDLKFKLVKSEQEVTAQEQNVRNTLSYILLICIICHLYINEPHEF